MYKNVFCERKCRLNGEKEGKGECKHRLIKENERVNGFMKGNTGWMHRRKKRI